jgi:dihydroflavonol-4-reductase
MAAIAYGHGAADHIVTEADWTDVNSPDAYPYVKSKTIAERAARDWIAAEGGTMEFVSVNPSLVLGPLQSGDFSTSLEAIKKLLEGSVPGLPNFGFGIVDVRDVADMHVRCLTAPDMAGERFICSGPFMTMSDIAKVLREGLGKQARKVPTRRLPNWAVRIAALFDPMVRQVLGELGNRRESPPVHAREKLGWIPRSADESILDTARSMIALGIVKV